MPWLAVYTVAVMSPRRRFSGCGSEKHGIGLRMVVPLTVCVLSHFGIAVCARVAAEVHVHLP